MMKNSDILYIYFTLGKRGVTTRAKTHVLEHKQAKTHVLEHKQAKTHGLCAKNAWSGSSILFCSFLHVFFLSFFA